MTHLFSPEILPFVIFFLRVANNAIGTVRIVAMNRGSRVAGFLLASLESLLFAYTAGMVLTNLDDITSLAAYVLGFSVGGYVGMIIEQRYLNIYDVVDIITNSDEAHEIALHLRELGHGVTEMRGEGARGEVCQLRVVAHQNDVREITHTAYEVNPNCFIFIEEARKIEHGWVRSQKQHER
jgi:uncharacterized protein YebE (UPF0316 family)